MSEIKAWLYEKEGECPAAHAFRAQEYLEHGYTEEPLVPLSLLQEAESRGYDAAVSTLLDWVGQGLTEETDKRLLAACDDLIRLKESILQKAEKLSRIHEVE